MWSPTPVIVTDGRAVNSCQRYLTIMTCLLVCVVYLPACVLFTSLCCLPTCVLFTSLCCLPTCVLFTVYSLHYKYSFPYSLFIPVQMTSVLTEQLYSLIDGCVLMYSVADRDR